MKGKFIVLLLLAAIAGPLAWAEEPQADSSGETSAPQADTKQDSGTDSTTPKDGVKKDAEEEPDCE